MNSIDWLAGTAAQSRWRRPLLVGLACAAAAFPRLAPAAGASDEMSTTQILLELRSFRETGSVLYIAAHPDDENNRLLAYLARGRALRTGYLSLTRGDGGQNLIGSEQGKELGVLRTQELLAARRVDGAEQFFTRAIDFGFSKDYRETFHIWDRQLVLADIVRVIRTFRPDVLINRFSTEPSGTHGHHTASGILGLEAFKLAGDPTAFPDQLATLAPWQPKRILLNAGLFGRGEREQNGMIQLDSGGYQPLMGESFGEIAAESRSMHKSQGMGSTASRGSAYESFRVLDGAPATDDILEGVDTTWGRIAGAANVGPMTDEIIAHFNPMKPSASVPALLSVRGLLAALPSDPLIQIKQHQLDNILQSCLGLYIETVVPRAEVVPGETLRLRHTVIARAGFPVRWLGVRFAGEEHQVSIRLTNNHPASIQDTAVLPTNTPLSQPYWLREEGTVGMFRVDDPALIGRAENPPVFPIEQVFEVGGQTLSLPDVPVEVVRDSVKGEIHRALAVIPPVSLAFTEDLELFPPGGTLQATVEVTAAREGAGGTLELALPQDWYASPAKLPFELANSGDKARLTFNITAPPRAATAQITAVARIGAAQYSSRRVEIRHEHIPLELLQPPARLKALSLELAIRGKRVGYLPGAGDMVAECLQRMGYTVTLLSGADLVPDRLRAFDAVVIGIRAFNTRADLPEQMPALFSYAQAGGNVIVQYNTPGGQISSRLAPYELRLSRDRVTDENAAVTLLAPEHPALTTPNRIVAADFDGWVQERGLYFPEEWDPHFTALLSCHDPGEPELKGGLLVAQYGKGYFVYTGLSWFRQLPEGVPGAYRLFANLLSLGK
jgi:LmbE family N-acetylglucosaminyl deacetylase